MGHRHTEIQFLLYPVINQSNDTSTKLNSRDGDADP
jgi:hypothetical protein